MLRGGRRLAAAVAVLLAAGLLVPVAVVPAAAQTPPPVDYDVDDDGLIEISSLAQLNAIRWDLDGDGAADVYPPSREGRTGHDPDGAAKLSAAFPNAATDMGCPADGCDGYELAADLDFDTNGSGTADSGDEFWNGGKGWVPLIGGEAIYGWEAELRFEDAAAPKVYGDSPHSRARMFTAVFEGNGRTIANLYIDDPNRWLVGLFGAIGPGAHVRNFGLSAPNADSRVRGNEYVGPLAGQVQGGRVTQGGRVSGVWSGVDVSGSVRVGGLVGVVAHHSFVIESYAVGDVSGNREVGGLAGLLNYSGVAASYAAGDVSGSRHVGGLAGLRPDGHARATYATGSVTRTQGAPLRWADGFGGLIGSLWHAYTAGWPRASYATGQVSVPDGVAAGGLMGECLYSDRPRAEGGNYWDTEATGLATSPDCGVGYTTAELQAPTGYEGIYADWDVDVDVGANYGWAFDGPGDDPWDFGSSSEYPVLKYCADKPGIDTADGLPFCPLQPWRQRGQPAPVSPVGVDYDVDGDGLVEVSSLVQLDAVRWDLDGDGVADVYPPARDGFRGHDPDGAVKFGAAFPGAAAGMGCPLSGCSGYELAADLDFDSNGNGRADAGDVFWNGGRGWVPLMGGEPVRGAEGEGRLLDIFGGESLGQRPNPRARMFTGIFEGNGRTVGNLFVDDTSRRYVGLFGYVGPGGVVRNVGLSAANADSVVRGGSYAGALAGAVEGARVSGVWSAVPVAAVAVGAHSGGHFAGGLVGSASRRSFVAEGWASGAVSGSSSVGGLVGNLQGSGAAAVWASGAVSGGYSVGGLVGYVSDSHVRAAYARSAVSASSVSPADSAGALVGRVGDASAQPWLRAVFASGAVSAPNGAAVGGLVGGCDGTAAARGGGVGYWDTQATGVAASPGCGTGAHAAPVGTAQTTAALQAPTGYEGVYAGWDVDVDVAAHAGSFDGPGDDPWHFGTSSQYPALKHCAAKPGIDTADAQPYCPLQPHSQRPAAAAGHTVDPDVVAEVKNLAAQAQHGTAHVNRWQRVLVAFGEHDGSGVTGGPMTADEAQQMADAHSSPVWDQVVAELTALEAVPLQTPPPPPPPPPLPAVSVTAAAGGAEGDPATFALTASPAPTADLTVSVTVATSGDFGYGTAPTSVTIPTSGTATVTVATADDDTDEPDGQVTLTVNTGTGYTVGSPATETATVSDDDDPVQELTGQGYTVDADVVAKVQNLAAQTQHGTAHVNRWQRVLAAFGEHDGVGVTGGPMTAAQAQQMADAHSSPVWDEVVAELAALQTATQTTPPPPPPPPPVPAVSITSSSGGIEGDPATFALTASPPPTADLPVSVTVAATGDFGAAVGSRTVTIPTSGTATVTVATADDDTDEPDGQVTLTLNTGSGYTIGSPSTETAAVADDDPPVPVVSITAGGDVTEGGSITFTLTASPPPAGPLDVTATVTAAGDWGAAAGQRTVTIPASGSATLTVATADDHTDEPDGTITATIAAGSGYTVSATQRAATVSVADDDVPDVSITAAGGVTEGGSITFTLTASPPPAGPLDVTATVTAAGDWGVTDRTRTVTVPASGTATLTVATADDHTDEPDGTVTATIAAGSGYTVSATQGTATASVADDDPPPVEQDQPDEPGQAPLAACDGRPTLLISSPQASRHDTAVDFEVSLSCIPADRPTILLSPLRDGSLSRNIFVHLSADRTSTTVTVNIGTEHQLALVLAWNTGLANHQAQGNVTYTD